MASLERFYVDDTLAGKGTHYRYRREDIESMIKMATRQLERQALGKSVRAKPMDEWLGQALSEFPLDGMSVAVFGSAEPYYESLSLAAGAEDVTTIEYNSLSYDHPKIKTITPRDVLGEERRFDAALSVSSFDHDGQV